MKTALNLNLMEFVDLFCISDVCRKTVYERNLFVGHRLKPNRVRNCKTVDLRTVFSLCMVCQRMQDGRAFLFLLIYSIS